MRADNGIDVEIIPLGECAFIVRFGDTIESAAHNESVEFARELQADPFPGFEEAASSTAAAAVYYNPVKAAKYVSQQAVQFASIDVQSIVRSWLEQRVRKLRLSTAQDGLIAESPAEVRTVLIPVCYCAECGPDLRDIADANSLSTEEAVFLHTSAVYKVYMIGFMPGFPYLGGLPERLAAPRRTTPRLVIPAGSVGIAGRQTGIYPFSSPGGWRLIGRTSIRLFDAEVCPPSLLSAGDRVRFKSVTHAEMEEGVVR